MTWCRTRLTAELSGRNAAPLHPASSQGVFVMGAATNGGQDDLSEDQPQVKRKRRSDAERMEQIRRQGQRLVSRRVTVLLAGNLEWQRLLNDDKKVRGEVHLARLQSTK